MLDRCAVLREQWQAGQGQGEKAPAPQASAEERRILSTLTEKDRAGEIPREILEDAEAAFRYEDAYPREVFESALLCPRIALEPLRPWRRNLASFFSQKEQADFRADPRRIWLWIAGEVPGLEEISLASSYPALSGTPEGILRLRTANATGRKILFCAFCRALGVPARLSPLDGEPEYWADGSFQKLGESTGKPRRDSGPDSTAAPSRAVVEVPDFQAGNCEQNYTLSRRNPEDCILLRTGTIPAGKSRGILLTPGNYRAVTTCRTPGGDQLAKRLDFALSPGGEKSVVLSFRERKISDMLECLDLPPFSLRSRAGETKESAALFAETPFSLMFWLEPGREPTEHILNELRESAEEIAGTGCGVFFILETPEGEKDAALKRALSQLPEAEIRYGDFGDTVPSLARQTYVDPEKLPLVMLVNQKGNCLYSSSGYNVGTAELLVRLLQELQEKEPGKIRERKGSQS